MDVAGERAVYIDVTLRAPDAPGYHFTKEWNTCGEPRGRTTKGASESAAILTKRQAQSEFLGSGS